MTLLADVLGGEFLTAYISAVAFATILAVVTGLVLSASSAFAHDVYSHLIRKGMASEREQVLVAKCSSVGIGLISMWLAMDAEKMNVAMLVSLTFAVAASAHLPLILSTLYWRRFTVQGAIAGMASGLLASVLLVCLGPTVMNPEHGLIPHNPIFRLTNPGLVSIPIGFLGAIIGTLCSRPAPGADERYDCVLLKIHAGEGREPMKEKMAHKG